MYSFFYNFYKQGLGSGLYSQTSNGDYIPPIVVPRPLLDNNDLILLDNNGMDLLDNG
jgi:hypothetical protein